MKYSFSQILSAIAILSTLSACQKSDDKSVGAESSSSSGNNGETLTQERLVLPKFVSNQLIEKIGHELKALYNDHSPLYDADRSQRQDLEKFYGTQLETSVAIPENLQTLRNYRSYLSRFRDELLEDEAKRLHGKASILKNDPTLFDDNFKRAAELRYINKLIGEKYGQSLNIDLSDALGAEYSRQFAAWLMSNKKESMDSKLIARVRDEQAFEKLRAEQKNQEQVDEATISFTWWLIKKAFHAQYQKMSDDFDHSLGQ